MLKLALLGLLGLFSISCSNTDFSSSDEQSFLASGITCNNERCTSYTVNDSAKISELASKTNILFVFDTSGSMADENRELANRMGGFVQGLELKGVSYNLCYTIADEDAFKGGLVERWSNGSSVLNNDSNNVADVFADTIDSIQDFNGSGQEEPISAAYHMISSGQNTDCLQNNIPLEVVILSDEDELSCANHCDTFTEWSNKLRGIKLSTANYPANLISLAEEKLPQTPFTVNSIVKQSSSSNCHVDGENRGSFHIELATLTGGVLGDICLSDYTSQLSAISKSIESTLDSVPLRCNPVGDIELTASNGMTFNQEIIKKRLHLTPAIPGNVSVNLTYDCNAE